MITYKLQLRPPGYDAHITTLTIEGRTCCPHSLSDLANNAAVMFDFAQSTTNDASALSAHIQPDADDTDAPTT